MDEAWVDIDGYNGEYQVSNIGRIKSIKFRGNSKHKIPKILKPRLTSNDSNWYFTIALYFKTKREDRLIHRIVAKHFIPNPENKPEVNHIDGDKNNNGVSNLEWVTAYENREHAKKIGLSGKGEKHARSILTEKQVIMLRTRKYGWGDKKMACEELKISRPTLNSVLYGRSWSHLNYLTADNIKNKTFLFHKT